MAHRAQRSALPPLALEQMANKLPVSHVNHLDLPQSNEHDCRAYPQLSISLAHGHLHRIGHAGFSIGSPRVVVVPSLWLVAVQ